MIEMVVATGVLALLALMLHTGLIIAQNSYNKMMGESETQLLLSTLSDSISNELRYARDVVTTDEGVLKRYTSMNHGRNTTLTVNSKGQLEANNRIMLSTGAYGNGAYSIDTLKIIYNNDRVFHVNLKVVGKNSISNEINFSVRCLNRNSDEGGNV